MSEAHAEQRSLTVRDLTAFQQAILVVLSNAPRYGLAIKRELEAYYEEEVNHGRLYPNLDDLVAMGLIEKSELDKRTNQYELTKMGHATVKDLLEWSIAYDVSNEARAAEVKTLVNEALTD